MARYIGASNFYNSLESFTTNYKPSFSFHNIKLTYELNYNIIFVTAPVLEAY